MGLLVAWFGEWSAWIKGSQSPVTREAVRLTTITRTLDSEKAERVLGYTPRVSLLEGIERGGKYFVEGGKEGGSRFKIVGEACARGSFVLNTLYDLESVDE